MLHPAEGAARPARIELAGLSDDEVSALRSRGLDDAMWASFLRVSVADQTDANLPAVAGHYAIAGRSVTFTPLYPFDAGRAYRGSKCAPVGGPSARRSSIAGHDAAIGR